MFCCIPRSSATLYWWCEVIHPMLFSLTCIFHMSTLVAFTDVSVLFSPASPPYYFSLRSVDNLWSCCFQGAVLQRAVLEWVLYGHWGSVTGTCLWSAYCLVCWKGWIPCGSWWFPFVEEDGSHVVPDDFLFLKRIDPMWFLMISFFEEDGSHVIPDDFLFWRGWIPCDPWWFPFLKRMDPMWSLMISFFEEDGSHVIPDDFLFWRGWIPCDPWWFPFLKRMDPMWSLMIPFAHSCCWRRWAMSSHIRHRQKRAERKQRMPQTMVVAMAAPSLLVPLCSRRRPFYHPHSVTHERCCHRWLTQPGGRELLSHSSIPCAWRRWAGKMWRLHQGSSSRVVTHSMRMWWRTVISTWWVICCFQINQKLGEVIILVWKHLI